jgi:hypothetical protein
MDDERREEDSSDMRRHGTSPDQFKAILEYLPLVAAVMAAPKALKDGTDLAKALVAIKEGYPRQVSILDKSIARQRQRDGKAMQLEENGFPLPFYLAPQKDMLLDIEFTAGSKQSADELQFKCSLLNKPGSDEEAHSVPILLRK